MAKPEIDALLQLVEEVDAFSNQRDLFGVVELQPEGPRGHRRGQGRQGGTFLENESFQPRAFREEGGGASDDAAADDDEVGALGR
jgi:hypothetical protein